MDSIDTEVSRCVCGETSVTGRLVECRDGASGQAFAYHTCTNCGAERLLHRPTSAQIGAFYPNDYANHQVRPASLAARVKHLTYLAHHASEPRLGKLHPLLKALLYPVRGHNLFAFKPVEPKRIYEFGAGAGDDLMLFKAEGWEVAGCEPSARAAAIAAKRGIVLDVIPAEAAQLCENHFSAVLMNNVFEHLHEPAEVLAGAGPGRVADSCCS
jgi:hypothetical protein